MLFRPEIRASLAISRYGIKRNMKVNLQDLSARELDDLISAACKRRIEIEPEVTHVRPAPPVDAVNDPRWYAQGGADGTLFQIRHPALGWLAFWLPPDSRAPLLKLLMEQALPATTAADVVSPASSSVH